MKIYVITALVRGNNIPDYIQYVTACADMEEAEARAIREREYIVSGIEREINLFATDLIR